MKRKSILIPVALLCGALLFSGCSFGQVVDRFVGRNKQLTDTVIATSEQTADEALTIDESLEAPVFAQDLTGAMTVIQGSVFKLQAEAAVSDGGTVTYQWYRNNVNANGGGTQIGGATDTVVEVDTTEAKSVFYYVVATNRHGESVNMSVSGVFGVTIIPEGSWEQDDTGFRYVQQDGTNPADTPMIVDGMIYIINADGYRTDDGQPAPEVMSTAYEVPGAEEAAEEVIEEAAAEEAAAQEETPAEEAPAEETPDEETQAEEQTEAAQGE